MLISERIKQKNFQGKNYKDAYLKACKWVSTNILAAYNSEDITYKIEKLDSKTFDRKEVRLTVYVTADEEEINQKNCEICRECSSLFYLDQRKHKCESCGIPPYRRRLLKKLESIKEVKEF